MHISRRPRRRPSGYHFALGLALAVAAASWPGRAGPTVAAQEPTPCALLTDDELKSVAPSTSVAAGLPNSLPSFGYANCRYAWGAGTGRYTLVVVVTEASRIFPGMTPDQTKQRLLESVRAGTADTVVPDVGDAAVFKLESYVHAVGTAFAKGRILQVQLDGYGALGKRDQVIGLLKSAASRLH
jgi:hypothetical protein